MDRVSSNNEATSASRQLSIQLALVLSRVFHPFVVTTCTVGLLAIYTTGNAADAWKWTGAYFVSVILPVLILLVYAVRTRVVENAEVPARLKRRNFYLVGIAGMFVLFALIELGNAPILLKAAVIAAILTNGIAIFINQIFTKISVHAAAIAGCTAALFPMVPPLVFSLLCIVTVLQGWARIRLKRHTLVQVLLGWIVAAASVILVYSWTT